MSDNRDTRNWIVKKLSPFKSKEKPKKIISARKFDDSHECLFESRAACKAHRPGDTAIRNLNAHSAPPYANKPVLVATYTRDAVHAHDIELETRIRRSIDAASRLVVRYEDTNEKRSNDDDQSHKRLGGRNKSSGDHALASTIRHRRQLLSIFKPFVEKNTAELNIKLFERKRRKYFDVGSKDSDRKSQDVYEPLPWPTELERLAEAALEYIYDTYLKDVTEHEAWLFALAAPLDVWRAQTVIMGRMLEGTIEDKAGVFFADEPGNNRPEGLGTYAMKDLRSCMLIEGDVVSCRKCFERLAVGDHNYVLPCDINHIFCEPCMGPYLAKRFECPVCHAEIERCA